MASWSDEETFKLIEIWSKDSIQAILESSRRNRDVYSGIAQKMEEAGFNKTADQCSRKMKKLRFEYRKGRTRGKLGKTGQQRSWRFFDAMDLVLGNKLVQQPIADEPSSNMLVFANDLTQLGIDEDLLLKNRGEDSVSMDGVPMGSDEGSGDGEESRSCRMTQNGDASQSGELSRNSSEAPSGAADLPDRTDRVRWDPPGNVAALPEGTGRKRRRTSDSSHDLMEFMLDKMLKMQQASDQHHAFLVDKQMEMEERTQKENQEFQLRLISVLCNQLPSITHPSSHSPGSPRIDRYNHLYEHTLGLMASLQCGTGHCVINAVALSSLS